MNTLDMLRQINQCLLMHINTLLTFSVYDPQNIKKDIDAFSANVQAIVSNNTLSSTDRELVSSINDYSKLIYCILSERMALQEVPSRSCEEVDENHQLSTSSCVDTTEESDADKKRNKRLLKRQLQILENWYHENLRHPYLTKDAIQELMASTSLSKFQVQNWYVFSIRSYFLFISDHIVTNILVGSPIDEEKKSLLKFRQSLLLFYYNYVQRLEPIVP